MSRTNTTTRDAAPTAGTVEVGSAAMGGTDTAGTPDRRTALAAFLRALARRVEQDPAFARTLLAVYAESSAEQPAAQPQAAPGQRAGTKTRHGQDTAGSSDPSPQPVLDPFARLRESGEAALHEQLSALDLAALRAILRAHRLDPARIAARWTSRERLAELIVEQVRARASLGRAFEHV